MTANTRCLLSRRFNNALDFAATKHTVQPRKGTDIPYVSHLLGVFGLILENGGNEEEAIAGLLHDVMEDQSVPRKEIADRFGESIAEIVSGCSDAMSAENKAEWRSRKQQYIDHVMLKTSPSVLLVSAADKLHNLRSILSDYRVIGEDL